MYWLIGLSVLLSFIWLGREWQLAKERTLQLASLKALSEILHSTRLQLRRATEDIFVLQALLIERQAFSESDLNRARLRLIEYPRRQAEQRQAAVADDVDLSQSIFVATENGRKVH